jgi:hypothetical protein
LLLPVGQDRHGPGHETEKGRAAISPKLEFRGAGTQVSPVTMSRSTLFAAVYLFFYFFFIFLLLFICAYKAWFISPP